MSQSDTAVRPKKSSVETHAFVDLPREVWELAQERAGPGGDPTDWLVDYLNSQFGFIVDGELVHETDSFDAQRTIPNDAALDVLHGEPVVELSDVHGEAAHGDD